MEKITKREAKSLLRKLVKQHGADKSRTGGLYFEWNDPTLIDRPDPTKPRCIVGHAAVLTGREDFIAPLATNFTNGSGITEVAGLPLTSGAVNVFDAAQRVQDGNVQDRMTGEFLSDWGRALAAALKV